VTSGEFNTTVLRGFPVLVEYNMHGGYADWWLCTMSGTRAMFIEIQLSGNEVTDIDEQCHLDNNEREWAAGQPTRKVRISDPY